MTLVVQEKALIFEIKKLKVEIDKSIKTIEGLQEKRKSYNKLKNSMKDKGKKQAIKINLGILKQNENISKNIMEIKRLSYKLGFN